MPSNHVKDLTGQRFGRFTVIGFAETRSGRAYWLCRCDCGNEKTVRGAHLMSGDTISCGCYRDEVKEKLYHRFDGVPRSTLKTERLHRIWSGMKSRCNNPKFHKYKRYGARGITVCPEWDEYAPFKKWALANGYSDDLVIDRIDNDGNYEPSNCRWVTNKQNCNNRGTCHYLTVHGATHTLSEWSDITGIASRVLWARTKYGIDEDRILLKGDLRSGRKCNRKG